MLGGWDGDGPTATISLAVFINPLVSWIWAGGVLLLLGTVVHDVAARRCRRGGAPRCPLRVERSVPRREPAALACRAVLLLALMLALPVAGARRRARRRRAARRHCSCSARYARARTVADSPSGLAGDMRALIRTKLDRGRAGSADPGRVRRQLRRQHPDRAAEARHFARRVARAGRRASLLGRRAGGAAAARLAARRGLARRLATRQRRLSTPTSPTSSADSAKSSGGERRRPADRPRHRAGGASPRPSCCCRSRAGRALRPTRLGRAAADRFGLYQPGARARVRPRAGQTVGRRTTRSYRRELLAEAGEALREERGSVGEVDAEIEREIAAARAAFAAARALVARERTAAMTPS